MATEHWIEFYIRPKRGVGSAEVRLNLKRPICLFDETPHSDYRKALARASRRARRELGLHPCAPVLSDPHDWSDSVDELSAEQASA